MTTDGTEMSPDMAALHRFGVLLANVLDERDVEISIGARDLLVQMIQTGVDRLAGPSIQSVGIMGQAEESLVELVNDVADEARNRGRASIDEAMVTTVLSRCKLWPFCG
ncbi:MAG: hypothetical protein ACRDJH_17230 [Thermomicrobiales bacterium]